MTIIRYIMGIGIAALSMLSCTNDTSLQQYLVDKQDDENFVKVDLATSLLEGQNNTMTQEQKDILATIRKVNIVAYPIKNDNKAAFETEKSKLDAIIDNDNYKTLSKMKSNNTKITLKYVGEEDAIDEVIVFASDDNKGFAVFRLIGDDMKPGDMIKLTQSIQKGDIDISKLNNIGEMFDM